MNPKYLLLLILAVILVSFSRSPGLEWEIHVVDSSGQVLAATTSVKIDSQGNPHISYATGEIENYGLSYAHWCCSNWNLYQLPGYGRWRPYQTSLALGPDDLPHAVCGKFDGMHPIADYYSYDGGKWKVLMSLSGNHCAMAMSDVGQIIVISDNWTDYPLPSWNPLYVYFDGKKWQCPFCILDTLPATDALLSCTFDDRAEAHVAYVADGLGLRYAVGDGADWRREIVVKGYSIPSRTDPEQALSIAVDSRNTPVISFYERQSETLRLATKENDIWNQMTVDSIGSVGSSNALCFDGCDLLHIVYYDATKDDLKYTRRDGDGWTFEVIDSTGDVGKFNSIGIDGKGCLHISYYDATNKFLKYAKSSSVYTCAGGQGDVDGNGAVNVIDVIHLFRHILGLEVLECCDRMRADCNADGMIDVSDAVEIVNLILGLGTCP